MKYIACIFIKEGIEKSEPSPMAGVEYHNLDSAKEYVRNFYNKGISNFLVFGSTKNKSVERACTQGDILKFIKSVKQEFGNKIKIHADVGLSPYSIDGHSTVIEAGKINEEKSYELASRLAVSFAKAGADYLAPCLSLHKQVKMIRMALDKAGFKKAKIHAYSAKFSSALYGPYRETIQSPLKGDNLKFYQTDYSNPKEALKQITQDKLQGADIVMVKPGMFYLDILFRARKITKLPLSVYHVSGEYTMIKEASKTKMLNEEWVFDEIHSAFKRAGADYVIGYAPEHFLRWDSKNEK
jgi:porphobilinogen synthase